MELDPSSAEAHTSLAVFKLFYDFDWEGCEEEFRRAIALNPNYGYAHAPPFATAFLAHAYGAAGDRDRALEELEELRRMAQDGEVLPFNLALVYLGLDDRARAIDNLERALATDSQRMAWIGMDAIFDPLRAEPRFVELLRQMGFGT